MLDWLYGRHDDRRKAGQLYGAVVAQARVRDFYAFHGVPDTPVGRYEMIALHLALLLDRLGAVDVGDEEFRRILVETFVTDMDDAMRELGIGDPSVPKNVKKAAAGLYQRAVDYRQALAETGDDALARAIVRHIFAGRSSAGDDGVSHEAVAALARYTRSLASHLAGLDATALREGDVTFPDVFNSTRGGGAA